MVALTVSKPTLEFKGSGSAAILEQPVTLKIGPVGVDASGLSAFGVLPYRRLSASAGVEVWDEGAKAWKPDPGPAVADLKSVALAFKEGEAEPWQGVIVAAGGKDGAGNPQFAKAAAGYPLYSFRGVFVAKEAADPTLGDPSDNVTFVSGSDKNLVAIGPGEDEELDAATIARLLLKDASLSEIGQVLIERIGGSARVTISNSAGATVTLESDGSIQLAPAAGKSVVVSGNLDADRITYLPGGGGSRQTL